MFFLQIVKHLYSGCKWSLVAFADHLLVETDTHLLMNQHTDFQGYQWGTSQKCIIFNQDFIPLLLTLSNYQIIHSTPVLLQKKKKKGNGLQSRKVERDIGYKVSAALWMNEPKIWVLPNTFQWRLTQVWILSSCLTELLKSRYYWLNPNLQRFKWSWVRSRGRDRKEEQEITHQNSNFFIYLLMGH